ncbi:MAG: pilus assembly protein [Xanthomonadaceae bacterium]|nr:pilus assembly protein [Xanthomonadaceae bacterium]
MIGQRTLTRRTQHGSVLILSLLVLLMLTLLALFSLRQSLLNERVAGGSRNLDIAFQAAEAALRAGDDALAQSAIPDPVATAGWYHYALKPAPRWTTPETWDLNATLSLAGLPGVTRDPEFVIEELAPVFDPGASLEAGAELPPTIMYRISAIGYGGNGAISVILQTTYRR